MLKTRAAVLRKAGEPWDITELDLDEPKAGEVLIRYGARPDRRGRRAQRRDLHGGPDLRRVVGHRDPRRGLLMVICSERTVALRSTLAADGYQMEIAEEGTRVLVTITAGPQACADCLVPKDLMRAILGQALGVPSDAIDLTYPTEER